MRWLAASVVLEPLRRRDDPVGPCRLGHARIQALLAEVLTGQAERQLEEGEHAQALRSLAQALELDPKSPGTRLALGRAYLAAGRPGEALPHLETRRHSPRSPRPRRRPTAPRATPRG